MMKTSDEYGNNKNNAQFETALAMHLLNSNALDGVIFLFNNAIIDYIDRINANISVLDSDLKQSIDLSYGGIKKLLNQPENITAHYRIQVLAFHKEFIEQFLYTKCSPDFVKQNNDKIPSLRQLSQNAIQHSTLDNNPVTVENLWNWLRPNHLFSKANRGRIKRNEEDLPQDNNFGITSADDLPNLPQGIHNFFSANINFTDQVNAKDHYIADEQAEIVKYCREHGISFISGASGTIGYIIIGMIYLGLHFDVEQLREYIAVLTAGMIALGHHSVIDIMSVATLLYIYPEKDSNQLLTAVRAGVFPFADPRPKTEYLAEQGMLNQFLDPKQMYHLFLPMKFKQTNDFQLLCDHYPEYLPQKEKIASDYSALALT